MDDAINGKTRAVLCTYSQRVPFWHIIRSLANDLITGHSIGWLYLVGPLRRISHLATCLEKNVANSRCEKSKGLPMLSALNLITPRIMLYRQVAVSRSSARHTVRQSKILAFNHHHLALYAKSRNELTYKR